MMSPWDGWHSPREGLEKELRPFLQLHRRCYKRHEMCEDSAASPVPQQLDWDLNPPLSPSPSHTLFSNWIFKPGKLDSRPSRYSPDKKKIQGRDVPEPFSGSAFQQGI